MMNKKALGILLCASLTATVALGAMSGCKDDKDGATVRYLNFKPEIATVYDEIATKYKEETGKTLVVETAASGTYEQTLQAKMSNRDKPVLFQINGLNGYKNWKDYCKDLKDTSMYSHLSDKTLAVKNGDGVYGIPYTVEGYGIIYNSAIMTKYFGLTTRSTDTGANKADDIKSFTVLKKVVEDMQAHKTELGIEGVFAATSLKSGEDWRWQTHLANLPIWKEFEKTDLTSDAVKTLNFTYQENYKNIFDLYLNNSTKEKTALGTVDVTASMAEFALEKCAMVQNGNWGASQILGVSGNKVDSGDIKYLPIYCGLEGEANQGLCVGTENYFAINSQSSEAEQKAADEFVTWLYTSATGKNFVVNKLKFIAPFDSFGEKDKPSDPLSTEVMNWMNKSGVTSVPWTFTIFPNQAFKDTLGASLLQYAQGTKAWTALVTETKANWAEQYKQLSDQK